MALYRYWLGRFDDLTDPTVGLDLPAGSAPRERIVTPDELLALLDALDEGDRAPFALAGMAGLRHGEIKALRVRDVVLGEGTRAKWPDRGPRRVGRTRRAPRAEVAPRYAGRADLRSARTDPGSAASDARDRTSPDDYPVVPGVGQEAAGSDSACRWTSAG